MYVCMYVCMYIPVINSIKSEVNESDPHSNVHYLGNSENKAWKKFQACTASLSTVDIYDFHIFLTKYQEWQH